MSIDGIKLVSTQIKGNDIELGSATNVEALKGRNSLG